MAEIHNERIAYKHGIENPDNEVLELHGFCDCSYCNYRKKYNRGLRNQVTVTVYDKNHIEEAKKLIQNWKCGIKQHTFKICYINM